ncbi:toll/interleukin-1 receptor domain-containing protein [uncultured Acetatifactor sp.]|uniref:toll/interleukin-1 receptor domain-containing protein n=1 Tax=uncultured Acetatifactor sp. TaxID=1671927 RepID=UPI00261AE837|nr:toll/interleukin-1 receptor domain-containing protein [uncultured Acetatifactor sp.]
MTPEGLNAQPDDDRESFIFISYAHQDKDEVLEIIGRMQAEGYRIWYNKRTDSSMEWAEHIAERLADCGYFIAFISPEYLASANCLDELNYARDKEKNRLLVYLSNVTLPAGLSMRINRLQAIHKYVYGQEEFYERLFQAKGLSSCMASSAPQPGCAPLHVPDSLPESGKKTPDGQKGHDTEERPSSAAHLGSAPEKRRKLLLLVPMAVCILLAVLIPFLFSDSGTDKEALGLGSADLSKTNGEAPPDTTAYPAALTLILDPADLCGLSFGMSPSEVREIMAASGATETDAFYDDTGILVMDYDPGTAEFNGSAFDSLLASFDSDGLYSLFYYKLAANQRNETIQKLKDKYGKPIGAYTDLDQWDLESDVTLAYFYEEEGDNILISIPSAPYLDMRDFTWGMSPAEAQEAEAGRSDPLTLAKSEPEESFFLCHYEGKWEVHGNPVNHALLIYAADQLVAMKYLLAGASFDSVVADLTALYEKGIEANEDGSEIGWRIMMAQSDSSAEIPIIITASSSTEGVIIALMDLERYQSLSGQ